MYTADIQEDFTIMDLVGNTGAVNIFINRIDKIPPEATSLIYSPSTFTNQDVEVILTTNERVRKPAGRSGAATGTVFTKIYTANTTETVNFYDHVYNL